MSKLTINPVSTVQLLNKQGEVTKEFKAKVSVDWVREIGKEDSITVKIEAVETEEVKMDDKVFPVYEPSRTYFFATKYGVKEVTVKDVREVRISKSGNHRLKTANGTLEIIPAGWLRVSIKGESWAF